MFTFQSGHRVGLMNPVNHVRFPIKQGYLSSVLDLIHYLWLDSANTAKAAHTSSITRYSFAKYAVPSPTSTFEFLPRHVQDHPPDYRHGH